MAKKNNIVEDSEIKFTKSQLIISKKYKHRADVIKICVNDDELLTTNELENRINIFLKGRVI